MARKKKAETEAAPAAETEVVDAGGEEQAPNTDDTDLLGQELSADDMEALIDPVEDEDVEEVELQEAPAAAEAAPVADEQPGQEAAEAEVPAVPAEATPEQSPETDGAAGAEAEAGAAEAEPAATPATEQTPAEAAAPAAVAEPAPAAAAEPVQTDEERLIAHQAWRTETEARLANETFNLTEEQAHELEESPATAIPKLAARLHLITVQSAVQAFAAYLPTMIEQHTERTSQAVEGGRAFFKRWPNLNTSEASTTLHSIGRAYRQANPNASAEEFIRDVGAATMVARGFPIAPDATPAAAAPAVTPASVPHAPVGGGAPAPGGALPPRNIFTELAEEVLADDS